MVLRYGSHGEKESWVPTTLDKLDKKEEFLESIIFDTPELLKLESKYNGILGPYKKFRQITLNTPHNRQIQPDIVFLSSSGHVIVVEVKRFINPELKDRRVLAQIIEYAGSFAALNEKDILNLFNKVSSHFETWSDLIKSFFPNEDNYEELANVILNRIQSGNINLIIACDKAPSGLDELIKGISSLNSLEFNLDVIEITPFINKQNMNGEIIFIPNTKINTEIIAKTAISITFDKNNFQPIVNIQTTSLDEIEENVRAVKNGRFNKGREWDDEEIKDIFEADDNPVIADLFSFTLKNSKDGKFNAPGQKINPSFGFYLEGNNKNSNKNPLQIFRYTKGSNKLKFYFNMAASISTEESFHKFIEKLRNLFGEKININQKEPIIDIIELEDKLKEFKEIILWFNENNMLEHN